MKTLFYQTYYMTPHLETCLELIRLEQEQKSEIRVITCDGALETCTQNKEHDPKVCARCVRKTRKGLSLVREKSINLRGGPGVRHKLPSGIRTTDQLLEYRDGYYRVGLGVCDFNDYEVDVAANSDLIEKRINVYYLVASFFERLIDEERPDKVVFFNERFPEQRPLFDICVARGIPFEIHERGANKDTYQLYENSSCHDLEYFKKDIARQWRENPLDEATKKKIAERWYTDRFKRVEQSWISFTSRQTEDKLPENFSRSHKNIAIFNSTIGEYLSSPDMRNPLYRNEIEALEDLILHCKGLQNTRIYLRMHPNLRNAMESRQVADTIKLRRYENLTIIPPDSEVSTYSLLSNSDKAVVFGSTIGAESCYWGKPCILVGRAFYEDLNTCYVPRNREQFYAYLDTDLDPKPKDGAYVYAFWESTRGEKYRYYTARTLFKGTFDGVRLNAYEDEFVTRNRRRLLSAIKRPLRSIINRDKRRRP